MYLRQQSPSIIVFGWSDSKDIISLKKICGICKDLAILFLSRYFYLYLPILCNQHTTNVYIYNTCSVWYYMVVLNIVLTFVCSVSIFSVWCLLKHHTERSTNSFAIIVQPHNGSIMVTFFFWRKLERVVLPLTHGHRSWWWFYV